MFELAYRCFNLPPISELVVETFQISVIDIKVSDPNRMAVWVLLAFFLVFLFFYFGNIIVFPSKIT